MVKRFLSIIVLLVILLQGANRTGLLNYVYTHRHEIAFALHFTDEKVIVECGSDYLAQGDLRIQSSDDDQKIPKRFSLTTELTLCLPVPSVELKGSVRAQNDCQITFYQLKEYKKELPAIFHPPGKPYNS